MEALASADIPLLVKLAYTAFMAVLVPVYLRHYGPTNFLYFCDAALLITLAGIWLESPLLISVAAVGMVLPQLYWLLDFFANCVGLRTTGMTDYMFDTHRPLFLRGLSLFHGWLPLLLIYLLSRTGYDPRAFWIWTALASVLVLVCYFYLPPPRADRGMKPVNINYVYGLSDEKPQSWMPQRAWLMVVLFGFPLVLYWPCHWLLARFFAATA